MKAIILTSSIFYLLGLKLTNQVELNQKSISDSIKIDTQKELILPKQDVPKLPQVETTEKEVQVNCGSDKETAPWVPLKEDINLN